MLEKKFSSNLATPESVDRGAADVLAMGVIDGVTGVFP